LQHLQSDRRFGASSKLFLNRSIQFYFKQRDKSLSVDFAKYDILPYNTQIVLRVVTTDHLISIGLDNLPTFVRQLVLVSRPTTS